MRSLQPGRCFIRWCRRRSGARFSATPHRARARRRIQAAIELVAAEPRPPAATQLVGGVGEWRVRTGDYRIIYEIHDQRLLVLVLGIGHRREIYRKR
jgi:mRNA interferase RelE/StbE